MFPAKLKRKAKLLACCVAALAAILWGIGAFIDYEMSLAVVEDGMNPGLAAQDAEALNAAVHPTEVTLGIPELKASGRLFVLAEGTNCRVISTVPHQPCQGQHYPARVKPLDGPRRGQIVWMCSDTFHMVNVWP
jgi:hypothetical protein